MSDVKLFRMRDLDLTPNEDGIAAAPVVNRRYNTGMGAGIGVFENCHIEWTVTYDEELFIKDGNFTLRVGDKAFRAGSGDMLWIPKNTPVVYEDSERVTFSIRSTPWTSRPRPARPPNFPPRRRTKPTLPFLADLFQWHDQIPVTGPSLTANMRLNLAN